MHTKLVKTVKTIGLFFIFSGIVIACDGNPFTAGLGPRVDINPPKIHEITPPSGDFLKESMITFRAKITDDIAVKNVDAYYRQDKNDNWKSVSMYHESDEIWTFTLDLDNPRFWIDNKPFVPNGDFYLYLAAYDDAKHATYSDPNSYIIKTGPPEISMNAPYLDADFWTVVPHDGEYYNWSGENAAKKPIVFSKGDILGSVFDAQGILAPYPKIKIWNPNKGETEDTCEWDDIKIDDFIGPSDWPDRNNDPPGYGGSRNIGFKLKAYMRNVDGTASDLPLPYTSALPYKFRIMASDIGESGTGINKKVNIYPPMDYPAAEIFIIVSEGPPALDLYFNKDDVSSPGFLLNVPPDYDIHGGDSPYGQDGRQNQKYTGGGTEFVIEARARHGSGIKKAILVVKNNSGTTAQERSEKMLGWALGMGSAYNKTDPNPDQAGDPRWTVSSKGTPEREYLFLSPKIKKGAKIPVVDEDGVPTGELYEFTEAEYGFDVRVWETSSENERDYTEKGFLVQIIDTSPDIVLTNVRAAKTEENMVDGKMLYTVNGVFRFNALISDDFGVDESRWWLLPRSGAAADADGDPVWDTPVSGQAAGGRTIYAAGTGITQLSPEIDTIGPSDDYDDPDIPDGHYTLYIRARGRAGNEAFEKWYFLVDQESDIPVISVNSPLPYSFISAAANLRGILTDDDNVGSYKIEFNNPAGSSTWMTVADMVLSTPAREFELNVPFASMPGIEGDGIKRLRITVADHPLSKLGRDRNNRGPVTNSPPFTAGWDKNDPSAPRPGYIDGDYILEFTRDTTPPVIAVTFPVAAPYIFRDTFTLRGTVAELNLDNIQSPGTGAPQIKWTINDGGSGKEGFISADGSAPGYTWELALDSTQFNAIADGTHTVRFDALDLAGNSGSIQVVFSKDSGGPAIVFQNTGDARITKAMWEANPAADPALAAQKDNALAIAGENALLDENPSIRGSFNDDHSRIGFSKDGNGEYYFEYRIYNSVTLTSTVPGSTPGSALSETYPLWEKIHLGTDPGKNVNWTIPLTGYSFFWSGADGIPDGTWWLDIRVQDRLGNPAFPAFNGVNTDGFKTNIVFNVDTKPPEIDWNSSNPAENMCYGIQSSNVFTLAGTARDVNLKELRVRINNGVDTVLSSGPFSLNAAQEKEFAWSWTLDKVIFDGLPEGQNTITFTAEDDAGRTTARQFSFIKDTGVPTLGFHNLTMGSGTNFGDTVFKIQGVAEDDYGIRSIETKIEKMDRSTQTWSVVSDSTGTNSAGYTMLLEAPAGGTLGIMRNWNKNIGPAPDLTLGVELYRITVKVTDRASPANVSLNGKPLSGQGAFAAGTATVTGDEVEFTIDNSTPTLVLNAPPSVINGGNHLSSHPLYPSPAPAWYSAPYPSVPAGKGYYITGTAENYNGMRKVTASLYEGNNAQPVATVEYPPSPLGSPHYGNMYWGILIPDIYLTDGRTYTVNVVAEAYSGNTASRTRDFTYDITPPSSSIITPTWLEQVTGTTVVRGTSNDNNAVSKVEYMIGKDQGDWFDMAPSLGVQGSGFAGGLYSWSYTFNANDLSLLVETKADRVSVSGGTITPNPSSNIWSLPFRIRVTDIAGNQSVNDISPGQPHVLILDPDGDIPKANIFFPSENQRLGGEVRVNGEANDNNWVYAVMVRTWKGTTKDTAGFSNLVRYPVNIPGTGMPNPNDERQTNEEGWAMATFSNPGTSVLWNFVVNQFGELNSSDGTLQDVIIEVMAVDSKAFITCSDLPMMSDFAFFAANPDQNRMGNIVERSFRVDSTMPAVENVRIERTNDTVPYQLGVRAAGLVKIHAEVTGAGPISKIQWRSVGYSLANSYEDMLSSGNVLSGALFTVGMPVQADGSSALVSVSGGGLTAGMKYMIGTPGTVNWTAIGAVNNNPFTDFVYNGEAITGSGTAYAARGNPISAPYELSAAWEQRFHYPLTISIDSTSRFPIAGTPMSPSSGNILLDIQAEDFASPVNRTQANLNIQIDNFYPVNESYRAPRNAATTRYWVQGIALDSGANSGAVGGVKEVLAYFKRGSVYYNPRGIEWGTGGVSAGVTARNIKDMEAGGAIPAAFPNYPAMPAADDVNLYNYGAARISKNEIGEDTNGNGYIERFSDTGGKITWGFEWDTTRFIDGPIELHFIVIDLAGNATHYKHDLYIRNHPPVISKITLKTDHTYSHTVGDIPSETGEYAPSDRRAYQTTDFMARNYRLRFEVDTMAGSGNGNKTFRVSPVTEGAEVASTAMVPGTVYKIVVQGTTDWEQVGASSNLPNTVFVCTDPAPPQTSTGDATTGRALAYVPIFASAADKEQTGVAGTSAAINFGTRTLWTSTGNDSDTEFGQNGNRIPDSTVGNGALFLVKVFDSTVGGGSEAQQQADVVLVGLNLNNRDGERPQALINPFHWNGAGDNSLYLNSRINGHIDLEEDLGASFTAGGTGVNDRDPKVSGQISIRGTASDNNVVDSLWVRMDGFTFAGTTNSTVLIGGQTYYKIAAYDPATGLEGMDRWIANGWKSTVTLMSHDQDGHKVNWQLDIDTGRRTNVTALDQTFRIIAQDSDLNTQPESSSQTEQAARTAYYKMDIVPYIREVVTRLSSAYPSTPSAFNRSALGWYPVREGETIDIRGFNLGGAATTVIGQGDNLGSVTVPAGASATNRITASVGGTIVSGALSVRVNGIDSLNNRNDNDAPGGYNMEPNNVNNNILSDDRNLYVWNTGEWVSTSGGNDILMPFMKMDNASNTYMTYGRGASDLYKNINLEAEFIEGCYNKYHNNTVAFDSNGNWYGGSTNTDRVSNSFYNGEAGGVTVFTFYSRAMGSNAASPIGGYRIGNNTNVTNRRRLEASYNNQTNIYDINRVKIPRMEIRGAGSTGNPARVYMSYYDGNSTDNAVAFRYGEVTAANTINGTGIVHITGFGTANSTPGSTWAGTAPGRQVVANNTSTYSSGLYTAVGSLSSGRAVVAWYDAQNYRLVFSYSNTDNPGTSTDITDWQANARVIDDNFNGWHVDLTVDDNNGIHIAYYNSGNGGLKYAYLSAYNAAPVVCTVDTFLSAGTKLMINTRPETRNGVTRQIPYISYYHATFPSTMNSIRVAWRNDWTTPAVPPDGTNELDQFTGGWEAMTVPASSVPNDDFVCNGVPRTGTVALTRTGNTITSSVNLTNSILLSYLTNAHYERAYLKK